MDIFEWIFTYLLELIFRGTNFGKFGSMLSLNKHLLSTCSGLGTRLGTVDGQPTKSEVPVLVELYFRRVCRGSGGRQRYHVWYWRRVSTLVSTQERWIKTANFLSSFGKTSKWLQNADPKGKKMEDQINASTNLEAKHWVKGEYVKGFHPFTSSAYIWAQTKN